MPWDDRRLCQYYQRNEESSEIVVKGLDLGDGKFLLAVAWVTKE